MRAEWREVNNRMENIDREDKGEEGKKRGRPTNYERLNKEKSMSTGKIDEIMRRKRERHEVEADEEKEIEKENKRLAKSPAKESEKKEGDMKELINAVNMMRTEIEEGRKEERERERKFKKIGGKKRSWG